MTNVISFNGTAEYVQLYSIHELTFKAIPYGTELYLKTTDDVIRMVRVVGGEWEGQNRLKYYYQIAGMSGVYKSTTGLVNEFECGNLKGTIYPKLECITKGEPDNWRDVLVSREMLPYFANYIMNGYDEHCYEGKVKETQELLHNGGTWDNCISFEGVKLKANGETCRVRTNFKFYFDKNGWHGEIPAIDNGELYCNKKEALSHYKPQIITFENEEKEDVQAERDITLTIKIKESDITKLKELCRIVK